MKACVPAVLLLVFIGTSACASEEDILTPQKVTIVADGGKAFGEVSATLEAVRGEADRRIKSVTLIVDGKTHIVPKEQISDLKGAMINTAEFRVEGSRDGGTPWLYLTFRLDKPGARSVTEYPRVYLRFRDGKFNDRTIHDPAAIKP